MYMSFSPYSIEVQSKILPMMLFEQTTPPIIPLTLLTKAVLIWLL